MLDPRLSAASASTSAATLKERPRRILRRFCAPEPLFSTFERSGEPCSTCRPFSAASGGSALSISTVSGGPSATALDVDSLVFPRRSSLSSTNSTVGCSLSPFRHAPLPLLLLLFSRAICFLKCSASSLDNGAQQPSAAVRPCRRQSRRPDPRFQFQNLNPISITSRHATFYRPVGCCGSSPGADSRALAPNECRTPFGSGARHSSCRQLDRL